MTESDYVAATNVARARLAQEALSQMLAFEDEELEAAFTDAQRAVGKLVRLCYERVKR
jgi:hypothetical protein